MNYLNYKIITGVDLLMDEQFTNSVKLNCKLLILCSHLHLGLPNGLFPSGFSTKIHSICLAHLNLLHFMILIFGNSKIAEVGHYTTFFSHVDLFLLGQNILLSALSSNTPSVYVLPLMWRTSFTSIQNKM